MQNDPTTAIQCSFPILGSRMPAIGDLQALTAGGIHRQPTGSYDGRPLHGSRRRRHAALPTTARFPTAVGGHIWAVRPRRSSGTALHVLGRARGSYDGKLSVSIGRTATAPTTNCSSYSYSSTYAAAFTSCTVGPGDRPSQPSASPTWSRTPARPTDAVRPAGQHNRYSGPITSHPCQPVACRSNLYGAPYPGPVRCTRLLPSEPAARLEDALPPSRVWSGLAPS